MNRLERIYYKLFRQKDRMGEYENLLRQALSAGYRVMSLSEWVQQEFPEDKILLLRHDVDIDARGAERMFQIELRLQVRATYYFRHLTMYAPLMKRMQREGFEIGLHYETLAREMKKMRISSKDEVTPEILADCRKKLSREVEEFRRRFGTMVSLCSHGAVWNRKVGIPNHVLVDNSFRKENHISFEAYDKELLNRIATYISDASVVDGALWRNGLSPRKLIEQGSPVILLLTHPEHWNHHFCSIVRKLWLSFIDRN